jgi:hypothetical protein
MNKDKVKQSIEFLEGKLGSELSKIEQYEDKQLSTINPIKELLVIYIQEHEINSSGYTQAIELLTTLLKEE